MSDNIVPTSHYLDIKVDVLNITSSLEDLQSDEQRRILDTVSQIRKCGLDSVLSLPQLVVCGDQSAGKSSVLEALTEISFPRNDNLCTRFATEIILRRAPTDSLTVKIIPDAGRSASEQQVIRDFRHTIADFNELPDLIAKATNAMGIGQDTSKARPFAKDVLSVDIEGPNRPQLTLVDIPGLIQTETKTCTKDDVNMVAEITEYYISQPRTICLAVVSASNDYANQKILTKVREVDPTGERTLGIITKPDRLPAGSGSEKAFLELARNKDIFFQLGWHVIKNRSFEEGDSSFEERDRSEKAYFKKSAFSNLSPDCLGIEYLRKRLSILLFDHVKKELPKLKQDLEDALAETRRDLERLGTRRSTPSECRNYLTQLSQDYYEICKAAADGHYQATYFNSDPGRAFSLVCHKPQTVRRFRAVVQTLNVSFSENMRQRGHKYNFLLDDDRKTSGSAVQSSDKNPQSMTKSEALEWVKKAISRTRGRELVGSYNPLVIGELFWEQSSRWRELAEKHINDVILVCTWFLRTLLSDMCPNDACLRLWLYIEESLIERKSSASREVELLLEDLNGYPINYNHYYTETVDKCRRTRLTKSLKSCLEDATTNVDKVVQAMIGKSNPSMESFSCEEALDCLMAIYKVQQKTFIANVTTQVIERHIVRGIEKIFSPVTVNSFSDEQVEMVAAEPDSAKRQRAFLEEKVGKLKHGQNFFRRAMGATAA